MDYGQILSRSWRITWQNKYLWVLGFLAALTRASSSSTNYSTSNPQMGSESVERLMQATAVMLALGCLALVLGLALWLLSLAAKGGLITAVSRIDSGESMTLGSAFRAGADRLLTLAGMNIVLYLPLLLIGVVGVVGAVALLAGSGISWVTLGENPSTAGEAVAATLGLFVFCLCGLLCIMMVFAVLLQFINAFAYRGIMLRGLGAIESLSHGWQVFRANLGEVLLLSLLFLVIAIGYGILVGIVVAPLAIALMLPLFTMAARGGPGPAEILFLLGGGLCLGLVGAALASILTTWQSATFTLAYQEWTSKGSKQLVVDEF